MIDRTSAEWAFTLGCRSYGQTCPFEADDERTRYWLDGRAGRPFRGLVS